jgi:ABC-type antimicrobial peptide transport system permease subunit
MPWYEIVGVAKDLGMSSASSPQREAGIYLPSVAGSQGAVNVLVHTKGDPMAIAPRGRQLAMGVDPDLRLDKMMPLDQITVDTLWQFRLWGRIILGLAGVTLLLSLAGIYAVLSYIVARRTREIGVRVALGASANRVIASIFRRPLIQVSVGVTIGVLLIGLGAYGMQHTTQFQVDNPRGPNLGEIGLLLGYAVMMFGVCTIACVVPTVRALRVQPTEALRAE